MYRVLKAYLGYLVGFYPFSSEVAAGGKEDIMSHRSNVYAAMNAEDVDSNPITPFTRFEIDCRVLSSYRGSYSVKRDEE